MYDSKVFPGRVINIPDKTVLTVKCLTMVNLPTGTLWKWPNKDDVMDYDLSEIVRKISVPDLLPGSKRAVYFHGAELLP